VPGALHRGLQRVHLGDVDACPAAERPVADRGPERAGREPLAAAAPLVVHDVPLPQVDDLAQGAYAGQLAEQALHEGGAASSESAQKEHACHFLHPSLVSDV
jgi:hypothetical protein